MAPARLATRAAHKSSTEKGGVSMFKSTLKQAVKTVGKRKAGSPLRDCVTKRAAFGDITNAIANRKAPPVKVVRKKAQENVPQLVAEPPRTRRSLSNKNAAPAPTHADRRVRDAPSRKSDASSEESLYVSAVEDVDSKQSSAVANDKEPSLSRDIHLLVISDKDEISVVPEGVSDFDKENWNDPFQVSPYATDIFNYLKHREVKFLIEDYLPKQKHITNWMRALLIDWMVEVQESFELNHETLYLAVKLVDLYLCKELTQKDELQLLGAASLFIASKFDERIPPLIDDFLYICDGAYTLRQLLKTEINVLKIIDFDLGIPLSYRFLRRYARCTRVSMPTLTLARFVLELCLMEYALISLSDSKMAAAALYLAIKMKNLGTWTVTHEYYTGYSLSEILPVARVQNICLHKKPKEALSTVRNKYSHKIFFEVAKVPLILNDELT